MEHVEYQSVILDSIIKPKAYYCVYMFYAKSHIIVLVISFQFEPSNSFKKTNGN